MHTRTARTALFVPATRLERIAKALASGADAVIVDLEDAVAPADKEAARQALAAHLQAHPAQRVWIRINGPGEAQHAEDVALCRASAAVAGIVVPKVDDAAALALAAAAGKPLWPIIESAAAVQALEAIVAVPAAQRLCFGTLDMEVALGLESGSAGAAALLDQLRGRLVLASARAGLEPPLDGVFPDFHDPDGLAAAMARARGMGFGGALCIHPVQVAVIHRVLEPDPAQLRWAGAVLEHAARHGPGVFVHEGRMVDAPVLALARRLLARAGPDADAGGN